MSSQGDVKKLIKQLKQLGWTVETGGKHYRASHPMGGFVSLSVSPSDHMAVRNMIGDINRLNKEKTGEKLL